MGCAQKTLATRDETYVAERIRGSVVVRQGMAVSALRSILAVMVLRPVDRAHVDARSTSVRLVARWRVRLSTAETWGLVVRRLT